MQETCDQRGLGLVVSAVSAWQRHKGICAELKALKASEHNWTTGKRQDFGKGTVTAVRGFEGDYGTRYLVKILLESGPALVWWASSHPGVEPGEAVTVRATVKEHSEYRGEKQTLI